MDPIPGSSRDDTNTSSIFISSSSYSGKLKINMTPWRSSLIIVVYFFSYPSELQWLSHCLQRLTQNEGQTIKLVCKRCQRTSLGKLRVVSLGTANQSSSLKRFSTEAKEKNLLKMLVCAWGFQVPKTARGPCLFRSARRAATGAGTLFTGYAKDSGI